MPMFRRAPDRPDAVWAAISDLRDELQRGYPDVSARRLRRIARRAGLHRFPDALMVDGRPRPGLRQLARSVARRLLGRIPQSRRHPLFAESYYRALNPDLANLGAPLWLHYQVYGRLEGRAPHPIVDLDYLGAQMPGVRRADLLDRYLTFPEFWLLAPSPYVDVEGFVLDGAWDGKTHPLLQLLRSHTGEPWVRSRLQTIDLGSARRSSTSLAVGVLRSRNAALFDISRVHVWTRAVGRAPAARGTATVIPGFLLAVDGVEQVADSTALLSPDGTAARLDDVVVTIESGRRRQSSTLVYFRGALARDELADWVRTTADDAVFAPADPAQEDSLSALAPGRVLAYGRQARVVAASIRTVAADDSRPQRGWPRTELPDSVIVLPESSSTRVFSDPHYRALLSSGVACALIGPSGVEPWIGLITGRRHVYADPSVLAVVRPYVDRDAVRILDREMRP